MVLSKPGWADATPQDLTVDKDFSIKQALAIGHEQVLASGDRKDQIDNDNGRRRGRLSGSTICKVGVRPQPPTPSLRAL